MPESLDEELALGLKQARKKPRNFALLAKGASVQKLLLSKKPIKPAEIQAAKSECKSNLVLKGVVQGDGSELVFKVVGDEPTIKIPSLREYLAEQGGMKLKPRFEVVKELEEIDDTDEGPESEGAESDGPVESPIGETPPAPAPTPGESHTGTDLIAGLVATMKSLAPHVQTLIGKDPGRKDELLGLVGEFQKQVKGRDAAAAKATLTALAQAIKQGVGSGKPETGKPDTGKQSAKVQAHPDFWAEWEKAKTSWRDAIDTVNDQLGKLAKELAASDDAELKRIAEFGLNAITADHRVPLQAAIIEVDQARSGDPTKAIFNAKECVVEFRDHIDTDERVEACDDNPFEIKVSIRESLDRALAAMEQTLGKMLA
jgi:hypothetical protein